MIDAHVIPKPRLLQISNNAIGGGGEELAVSHIARLLTSECVFEDCIFDSSDWQGEHAPPIWQQAAWTFYNPKSIRKILEIQHTLNAQAWIVHNWIPVASARIYSTALKENIPIVQFLHNFRPYSVTGYAWVGQRLSLDRWPLNFLREIKAASWQDSRLKTAFLAAVLTFLHMSKRFRAVQAWIAVSEFVRERFLEAGVPAAKIFTLRHAWSAMREPPPICEGDHYLFLGRLIEAKGVKTMVRAWEILARQRGQQTPKLVIAGDGPLATWLSNETEKNPYIYYVGPVAGEQKHKLLATSRGVIVPSLWCEPLGLVAYESYDYGKPVLAARSGGLSELVQDHVTGLLHGPDQHEELAQQVNKLEAKPEKSIEMGQAGRKWLLANTSEAAWQKQFLTIVQNAIDRSTANSRRSPIR